MSTLPLFKLEDYLSPREFNCKYFFSSSDMESRSIESLLRDKKDRENFLKLGLGYATTKGSEELREILAKDYFPCTKDDILSFVGAEEGIYATMRSMLTKDDHVIAVTPCYESHLTLPENICDFSSWELETTQNSWSMNLNKLRGLIKKNTKLIVVNFPHNPTGFIPSQGEFKELVAIAKEKRIYLFNDEVYWGLEHKKEARLPSVASVYEKGISLNVMSKSYGLAGLRYGWIACQEKKFMKNLSDYKHYLSICSATPSEFLTILALKQREEIWQENRDLLMKNYKIIKDYFVKSDYFKWYEPQGSAIAYPKYLGKEPMGKVADKLFKEQGILVLPCDIFNQKNNHFRSSYGRAYMPEALNAFKSYFDSKDTHENNS